MSEITFIQSYSGRSIDFLDPKVEQIDIDDIAHALSLLCRFGGHCRQFYSVAQHSVIASWNVKQKFALEALLHDSTEAFLVDMPRPIKQVLKGYRDIEKGLDKVIREKFNLPEEMTKAVHLVDNQMLATEKRDLMKISERPWSELPDPFSFEIKPWSSKRSYKEFLERYHELAA